MMQETDIIRLESQMKKNLEPKRYMHTLGVAYTAANLAYFYDADEKKAITAGLLHDCAKCLSHKKRVSICKKNHVEITPVEMENPVLLHAKAGYVLAQTKYEIKEDEILSAILYHTTGRPDMSVLEKIIFVADYTEPHRKKLPNLHKIRITAYNDLDMAVLMILENSLNHLRKESAKIDTATEETYDFYKELIEKREAI